MMQAYRTEGNYRSAARLSPAELRAAMANREILQATALAFDTQRQLRFEIGGVRAVMPFAQCADGAANGTVRDIAVLTRVGRPHPHPAGGGDDRRQLRPPDCRRGGVRRPGKGGGLAGLPLRLYGGAGRHHLRLCGRAGGVNGLLRGQNENESGSRMASALVHFVEKASQSSHPQARSK